ncbi:MAG: HlyD family secretion protein [Candidatus Rokubacteria bacterium]|nr:HlyD family secretion protein [Candidatus Rokubacteria bacterium]
MSRKLLVGIAVLVLLGALSYGARAWYDSLSSISTDDAYVEGAVTPVSAKVTGHVLAVAVADNQAVKAGDLLFRIDPRDYQARRDQARAAVAVAEASHRAARAELPLAREVTRAQGEEARAALEAARVAEQSAASAVDEAQARLEARRAAVAAMRADVSGAESAARQGAREMDRMRRLARDGYVAVRDFDQAESAAQAVDAVLEATRRRLSQTEKEAQQAEAELASRRLAVAQARERVAESRAALGRAEGQRHQVPVKEAELGRAEGRLAEARADLALAELQLGYAEVRAPADGVVAKKSVEVGQVVQAGQPLLAIVPLHAVWVVANFKETQLARVRPGLPARVEIDGYPGKTLHGTVDSLSAGTGSRFSLLPPENATGNWVKVVQRVPVKIRLDATEVGNPRPLRAGMSAVVTIKVK